MCVCAGQRTMFRSRRSFPQKVLGSKLGLSDLNSKCFYQTSHLSGSVYASVLWYSASMKILNDLASWQPSPTLGQGWCAAESRHCQGWEMPVSKVLAMLA